TFNVTNGSIAGYKIFIDGVQWGSNIYQNRRGLNTLFIDVPSDGKNHIITLQDIDNNICAASQFYVSNLCSAECILSELKYDFNQGKRLKVLVRDFDFFPKEITAEVEDTIVFDWVGEIPHTVTSDVAQGPDYFNSDLLAKGAQYLLPLSKAGKIGYYCVPHGSPGIGMAGSIDVKEECDDNIVEFVFSFISSGATGTYDVFVNNVPTLKQKPYVNGPFQQFNLPLLGDASSYFIEVIDNKENMCKINTNIENLDCNDPCFGVNAKFNYAVDYSNLKVKFEDKSNGIVNTYDWDFGNGQTSKEKNPEIVYASANTYEVCLIINKGTSCEKKYCDKLRLATPVCIATFEYEQDGLKLNFKNKSQYNDPQVRMIWSFGDNTTSFEVDSVWHTFKIGKYQVCLTIQSDQCTNTYCEEIDLSDECLKLEPNFIYTYEGPEKRQVIFTNTTNISASNYLWGFGDGTTSAEKDALHIYSKDGQYNVCLLVQDKNLNCSVSECKLVPVGLTSVHDEITYHKLRVIPNPTFRNQNVYLKGFNNSLIGKEGELIIYDNSGKILQSGLIKIEENTSIKLADTSSMQMVTIRTGRHLYAALVFVQ
ncbi:MAG: hypothetical protein RLZZ546_2991, partial [Bacteroidota bacterium]